MLDQEKIIKTNSKFYAMGDPHVLKLRTNLSSRKTEYPHNKEGDKGLIRDA